MSEIVAQRAFDSSAAGTGVEVNPTTGEPRPLITLDGFSLENVDATNIDDLYALLQGQAQDHNATISGDVNALGRTFSKVDPEASFFSSAIIVRDTASGQAVAYQLSSDYHGNFGEGLYLEDIYVKLEHQRHGLGRALYAALGIVTQLRQGNLITCTVDEVNGKARGFYAKCDAHTDEVGLLDLMNFRGFDANGANKARVHVITPEEAAVLDFTNASDGQHELSPNTLTGTIVSAANHPHNQCLAYTPEGASSPTAIMLLNTTFSTFRNVPGLYTEPVISLVPGEDMPSDQAILSLLAKAQEIGNRSLYNGHLKVHLAGGGSPDLRNIFADCASDMTGNGNSAEFGYLITPAEMHNALSTRFDIESITHLVKVLEANNDNRARPRGFHMGGSTH